MLLDSLTMFAVYQTAANLKKRILCKGAAEAVLVGMTQNSSFVDGQNILMSFIIYNSVFV